MINKKYFFQTLVSAFCLTFFMFASTASAQYKTGEIYDKDGLKGIIVYVDDSGEHGLLMSMESSFKDWADTGEDKLSTPCFYEDDGLKNMDALAQYIEEKGYTWEKFPVFEWARSLGDGWYIPAKDELQKILLFINDGVEGKYQEKYAKALNKSLTKAGAEGIFHKYLGQQRFSNMFSSTEADMGFVYQLQYSKGLTKVTVKIAENGIKTMHMGKMGDNRSRAVHKF